MTKKNKIRYEPQRHLFEKYGISRKKDENDKND